MFTKRVRTRWLLPSFQITQHRCTGMEERLVECVHLDYYTTKHTVEDIFITCNGSCPDPPTTISANYTTVLNGYISTSEYENPNSDPTIYTTKYCDPNINTSRYDSFSNFTNNGNIGFERNAIFILVSVIILQFVLLLICSIVVFNLVRRDFRVKRYIFLFFNRESFNYSSLYNIYIIHMYISFF